MEIYMEKIKDLLAREFGQAEHAVRS
jgi:hypothetical protein